MRVLLLAATLAVASPAFAGSKVGGGTPPPFSPCDAACEQAKRDAEKEAQDALANGSGDWVIGGGRTPKKKPGAGEESKPATPPSSSTSRGSGVLIAPASAPSLTSGEVSAVGIQPATGAAKQGVKIPPLQTAPPVGPQPR